MMLRRRLTALVVLGAVLLPSAPSAGRTPQDVLDALPAADDADIVTTQVGGGLRPQFAAEGENLIRLQSGAFDPLRDPPPAPPGLPVVAATSLPDDVEDYWLVQVRDRDFAGARAAAGAAGAAVAGTIPDNTYVVRAKPAQAVAIAASPSVRWVGYLQPAWRVPRAVAGRPALVDLPGTVDYRVYAFSGDPRLRHLDRDLAAIAGVELLRRDGPTIDVRATAAQVPAIAALPPVQWVSDVPRFTALNANARWVTDTGVRDVYAATALGRLTGAGQTAAVADTGVNYVPDLNGRAHVAFSDCDPAYVPSPEPPPTAPAPPAAPAVHATFSFDDGLQGWRPQEFGSGAVPTEWVHDEFRGPDNSGAVKVEPYFDEGLAILSSPEVLFEAGRQPRVEFDLDLDLEEGFDYLRVEYRAGGGAWKTAASFTGFEPWHPVSVDLRPTTSGDNIAVRFVVTSDEFISTPPHFGLAIDNVVLLSVDRAPGVVPEMAPSGVEGDCKLADYTQAEAGSAGLVLQNVLDNRAFHGDGPHRKLAAYFDLGDAGVSPRDESAHGTHVAGSVTADYRANGTWDGEDGLAPGARLVHQNIADASGSLAGLPTDVYQLFRQAYRPRNPGLVPNHAHDPADYAHYLPAEDARTHNNSWGALPLVDHDGTAVAVDEFVWHHEDMVIVVSAGNSGPGPGTIGNPSFAKNNLSSAASANGRQPMASIDTLASFSSHGPTADGRLGPDLATPGQTVISPKGGSVADDHYLQGTSMSGPILTGLATLTRQYFWDGYGPADGKGFAAGDDDVGRRHNPSAALVKATLVNGAQRMRGWYTGDDGTERGLDGQWPSMGQGFGLVNLDASLYFSGDPVNNWYHDVWRADAEAFAVDDPSFERAYRIDVAAGQPLDVTLAWTDAPNLLPAGTPALVNNLDLVVEAPDGTLYSGNNMNTRVDAGTAEATTLPGPPTDTKNPLERVRIAAPAAGTYTVRVLGTAIADGPQGYALAAGGRIAPAGATFQPGPALQVDAPGAPSIVDGSVAVSTYSADTTRVTFSTNEPTVATVRIDVDGDGIHESFTDVYNQAADSRFVDHYKTGPVETSGVYGGRPVVGTEHEILVFGTGPGTRRALDLEATDLAGNAATATTTLVTPASAFQPAAADIGQLYGGMAPGWQVQTQLYAGPGIGTGALGAFMFRVPEGFDPDRITSAGVELTGKHVLSSFYDADPTITVDLLDDALEPNWGTQDYDQIHNAPADARAFPETKVLIGAGVRHTFSFTCRDLEALKATLRTVTGGERRAAFRVDSVVDAAVSLPSYEFGFNRRSRGPELRPRLVFDLDHSRGAGLVEPCNPDLPAPTISDVGVAAGLTPDTAVVSWRTDVPSDSLVIFREKGTKQWIQVGGPTFQTSHHVEVHGVSATREYEFGVRSTTCGGASTTADNNGEGWDFFYPIIEERRLWFHGTAVDQVNKLAAQPSATFDGNAPSGTGSAAQLSFSFAGSGARNVHAAYWVGRQPGDYDHDLEITWWWSSSDPAAVVFGQDLEIEVWAEASGETPAKLLGRSVADLSLGTPDSPVRNVHRVTIAGAAPGSMVIRADPVFTIPGGIAVHYGSETHPSGISYLVERPPAHLPLTGPLPPPSAASSKLKLDKVQTRRVTSDDIAAGTAICEAPHPRTRAPKGRPAAPPVPTAAAVP